MVQLLKTLQLGVFTVIIIIAAVALVAEMTEYENIAKLVVIPSLVLLIIISGYTLVKNSRVR